MSIPEILPGRIAHGPSRVTREQQALTELGTTRYAAGVRETLVIVFLLTIAAVPLTEGIKDIQANILTRREMLARGVAPEQLPGRRPRALEVLNLLPSWHEIASVRGVGEAVDLLPTPQRLRKYED